MTAQEAHVRINKLKALIEEYLLKYPNGEAGEAISLWENHIQHYTQMTICDFSDEEKSAEHFDSLLSDQKFFSVEKEVCGRRLFDDKPTKTDKNGQSLRIDRLLHPQQAAYENGWKWGAIGVEIKKSDIAIGGIIAQVLEQRQSIFRSKQLFNSRITPMIFSVFPTNFFVGDVASVFVSQGILSCKPLTSQNGIEFLMCGGKDNNKNFIKWPILRIEKNKITVNKNWKPSTAKGHRGLKK